MTNQMVFNLLIKKTTLVTLDNLVFLIKIPQFEKTKNFSNVGECVLRWTKSGTCGVQICFFLIIFNANI